MLTLLIILSTISVLGMLAIFIMVLLDYKGNNSSLIKLFVKLLAFVLIANIYVGLKVAYN